MLSTRVRALTTARGTSSLCLRLCAAALIVTAQMFAVVGCVILSFCVQNGYAQEALQSSRSPLIVIGFMGGRIRADNTVHREASFAAQLQRDYPGEVRAEVFANRDGRRAYQEVLRLLDANHDGVLSSTEKRRARIVIYGHSWGASETVSLARRLGRDGIPVLLTAQVDSVAKKGEQDEYIPANVIQAANFYQVTGLLHGRRTIHAVDPAKTKIVGSFQLEYRDHHVQCRQFPWYARAFMRPHIEIENDPRVWNRIETMIQAELPNANITDTMALASRAQ